MSMTDSKLARRSFLTLAALGAGGLVLSPLAGGGLAFAQPAKAGARAKTLVVIFQRGALDGVGTVVPYTEASYAKDRPSIALARPGKGDGAVLDLDGRFGLHPALAPLLPAWKSKELAILHAVGAPEAKRSHFDAQDDMELAVFGAKTDGGWLTRCLARRPAGNDKPLSVIALGGGQPLSLSGSPNALAINGLDQGGFAIPGNLGETLRGAFESLYPENSSDPIRRAGRDALRAMSELRKLPKSKASERGDYPKNSLGKSLSDVARLVKANVGLTLVTLDVGGWDTHTAQSQRLEKELGGFAQALSAFLADLGDRRGEVLVLSMSEFGRTIAENGTRGTDHGHGTISFALGGGVAGGRVHGRWPGLAPEQRYEGRDLAVTTDFRDLMAEVATKHFGITDTASVFPGFSPEPARFPGVLA
jgi:uncharacterized protein (DUF1501 family)